MSYENHDNAPDSAPENIPNNGAPSLPIEEVFVVDAFPLFHPIRLPAHAFYTLHRETASHLDTFVANHRRKFPQITGELSRDGRR